MSRRIPFKKVKMKVPVIELKRNRKSHYAIIDTGSELTLFDELYKENSHEAEYKIDLTGVGGTLTHSAHRYSVDFVLMDSDKKKLRYRIDGLCVEDSTLFKDADSLYGEQMHIDIVLGSDMLRKMNAKIDYENNVLVIDDLSCQ